MSLVIRVAGEPVIQLHDCPVSISKAIKREFHDVQEVLDGMTGVADFEFCFGDTPAVPPDQALIGVVHRYGDRYFGFDRLGAAYELPFGPRHARKAQPLSISPSVSADFLLPNILIPLIHLSLLPRNGSLIHSAAVAMRDSAIVLAAWGGTGKTSTLISLMRHQGGQFLADDLAAVTADVTVYSLGNTINVLDYNLRAYGDLRRHFGPAARFAATLRRVLGRVGSTAGRYLGGDSVIAGVAARLAKDAKALANAKIPAELVEGLPQGPERVSHAPARLVIVLERGAADAPKEFALSTRDAAAVMTSALVHEFSKLLTTYRAYRGLVGATALPELESLESLTLERLERILGRTTVLGLRLPVGSDDHGTVAQRIMQLAGNLDGRADAQQESQELVRRKSR